MSANIRTFFHIKKGKLFEVSEENAYDENIFFTKQEINNKDQKDALFNNNIQNVDEKMEVVASEHLEEQKDNIKRKITIWVLIAIVIILILLVIYIF